MRRRREPGPRVASTFIIDGYNLLHRLRGVAAAGRDLEAARGELERRLRAFLRAAERGTRVILVYDGARAGPGRRRGGEGLDVVFSRPPQSADDVVLELCRRFEGRGRIEVVTSDLQDIGIRLRGLECRHWTSEAFAAHLAERLRPRGLQAGAGEKPRRTEPSEVDDWLRAFGMHPDEEPGGAP
jgi:predicted RNA-binding protein with PIN domain